MGSLVPRPSRPHDRRKIRKARSKHQGFKSSSRIGNQDSRISGPSILLQHRHGSAYFRIYGGQDLPDRISDAGPEIVRTARVAAEQPPERKDVRSS